MMQLVNKADQKYISRWSKQHLYHNFTNLDTEKKDVSSALKVELCVTSLVNLSSNTEQKEVMMLLRKIISARIAAKVTAKVTSNVVS